ncbi:MAG: RNA methyltransferase [Clostridia bacterium]|nr:RNA methyltransferase [Clostridia bacterium]
MIRKEKDKFIPSNILEGMTSISALLNSTCENDRKIERIWIDNAKRKSKAGEIGFLTAKSKEFGFSIEFVNAEQIDALTVGNTHGGILAFCTDRTLPILRADKLIANGFYVYLDGIEDPYNFGYTVRSLYAAGVNGIVLPPRNWMSAAGVVARASAGASELIPMYTANTEDVLPVFQSCSYRVLCAGIRDSVSVFDETFPYPILLVIGGEKRGISRKILEQADQIVRIDYGRDFRGSLSSASAATVMAFEIYRQNRKR